MTTAFWNRTNGVRPHEPIPGIFAKVCEGVGHAYDDHYGPSECARCGHVTPKRRWWRRL